ncbi:MAG: hypothetical protein HY710_13325 [Candidatus Latescibacteria bacterium]|nr:hypothetical protein [Candidatus Latescibacterota bacterium]
MRTTGNRILLFCFFLLTTPLTLPVPALAWWEKGHRIVTANAVAALPDDMPRFFKDGAATLIRLSSQPDEWRRFGTELGRTEGPDHYLDTEKLAANPTKLAFQSDRYAALKTYFEMKETPAGIGLLPYRLTEDYQRLRGTFAQYRKDPTNPSIQQEILVYAGLLSHYAGDTAQPLHTTIHFNGRVDQRGTVITGKGIHERFEGVFVDKFIQQADCRKYVGAPVVYPNLSDAIREALAQSFAGIDEVYRLDETGKLKAPDSATKTFVQQRLAHGSHFLTSLWYTAWKESEMSKGAR